ncbi:MAG: hypothetical protein WD066_06385 [Planctomycetaceae bacterium]
MRNLVHGALALGLVGLGYALGASGILDPDVARAQQPAPAQPAPAEAEPGTAAALPDAARDGVVAANTAIKAALDVLQQDGRYVPVINSMNAFAASVGGADVLADLEAGRGVDPETFAALYAGLANETVSKDLGKDEEGRVTYKGNVVRMYPVSRLRALFQAREQLSQP